MEQDIAPFPDHTLCKEANQLEDYHRAACNVYDNTLYTCSVVLRQNSQVGELSTTQYNDISGCDDRKLNLLYNNDHL